VTTSSPGTIRPADRYGAPSPVRRRAVVVTAAALVAAGVAWAVWVAWGVANEPVRWADAGFTVRGDTAVDVTFQVTTAPGSVAVCTVRALNDARAEVGLLDVRVGPSTSGTIRTTATVPTTERAVAAAVRACAPAAP
jgi:hypothetical protein